jgi:hypothetical protein
MNEKIKELIEQATSTHTHLSPGGTFEETTRYFNEEKFAELIVRECCQALNPMLRDMISRGHAVDLIKQHFGVEE